MTLSRLTSSENEMLAEIANVYGASPAVSALTSDSAKLIGAWHAAVLGGSNPYKTMSVTRMLAAIRNSIVGGAAKSHLTSGALELLADIAGSVQGAPVSRYTTGLAGMLAIITGGGALMPLGVGTWDGGGGLTTFQTWLGRNTNCIVCFPTRDSWAALVANVASRAAAVVAGKDYIWSLPLVVDGGTFTEVINGSRDSSITAIANSILSTAPVGKKIVIRLGWEFNLTNWAWYAGGGNETNFVNAYIKFKTVMKAVSSRFAFELCINASDGATTNIDTTTDGLKSHIEIVSNDVYWTNGDNNDNAGASAFGYIKTKSWGLDATRAFATANNLYYAVSEMGCRDEGTNGSAFTGPLIEFSRGLFDWIYANNVRWAGWWEGDHGGGSNRIANGDNPLTAALFRAYFGAPTVTTAATSNSAQNVAYDIALTTDQDGIHAITWSVVSGAATIVSGNTLRVTAAAAGDVAIVVRATNDENLTDDQAITHTFVAPHVFVNAEASAYVARMTTAPSETRKALIDAFYTAIKAGAISGTNLLSSRLDAFWLLAAHDSQAGLLNGVGTYADASLVNGPTFTVDRGFTGLYADPIRYIQTGLAQNRSGNKRTQNSGAIGAWELVNIASNSNAMGNGTGGDGISGRLAANGTYNSVNDFGTPPGEASTDSRGFWVGNRSGASARQDYKNGLSVGTGTASAIALGSSTLRLLTNNDFPDARQVAFAFQSSSMSANEQKDFYNAARAYLVGVGAILAGDFAVAT